MGAKASDSKAAPESALCNVATRLLRPSGRPVTPAPASAGPYRPIVVRPVGGRFDGVWRDVERFDVAVGERELAAAVAAGLETVLCQVVPMTDAELAAARATDSEVFTIDPAAAAKIKAHKVADLFPGMSEAEYAAFRDDVKANGQSDPAWLYKGDLIDGRHRRRACVELGIPLKVREWDGNGSLVGFVVGLNLHRRHLSSSQRAALAAEIEPLLAKEAKERQKAAGGDRKSEAAKAEAIENTLPPGSHREKLAAEIAKANAAEQERRRKMRSVEQKVAEPIRQDQARDQAAKITGTNRQYVSDAKAVKEKAPELFEKVKAGEITLPQAKVEVRRQEKREELKEKAAAAEAAKPAADSTAPPPAPWRVVTGDVCDELRRLPDRPKLIFADPPYNVGIDYGDGGKADQLPGPVFTAWVEAWVSLCREKIDPAGTLWLLISDEFAAEACLAVKRHFALRNWVVWYESFGVNCANKFNRCKRHLFYAVADPKRFTFNPDAVTRPSARQTVYGDGRAAPGGKLWDDVWAVPRLVGTAAERIPDFPTQLPLDLLRPVVGCSSDPGDLVLDPFCGSGTTGVAALESGRRFVGVEKSAAFADAARLRLKGVCRDAG